MEKTTKANTTAEATKVAPVAATTAPATAVAEPKKAPAKMSLMEAVKAAREATGNNIAADGSKENSARSIIADPNTEKLILGDVLRIEKSVFDQFVALSKEIVSKTEKLNKIVAEKATKEESEEPFPGTPAVVLFNVLHSVGILAYRVDDYREMCSAADKQAKTRGETSQFARQFEKTLSCYLAAQSGVPMEWLSALDESDLRINRF
jgi:hypothetical protein